VLIRAYDSATESCDKAPPFLVEEHSFLAHSRLPIHGEIIGIYEFNSISYEAG